MPALLAATPFLILGCVVAFLLGLRNVLLTLSASIPIAIGAMVLMGELFSSVSLDASPLKLALATIAGASIIALIRWLSGKNGDTSVVRSRAEGPALLGALGGAVIGLCTWLPAIGNMTLPPQGNDDIFHGYLIKRLLTATDISAGSMAPVQVDVAQPSSYYPYGSHLSMAFDVATTGADISAVMKGTWALILGIILPCAIAGIAHQLFPRLRWAPLWAGLSAPVATPLYLVNGIMPYALALALALSLATLALRRIDDPYGAPSLAFALASLGLFVVHPASAAVAALLTIGLTLESIIASTGAVARVSVKRLAPPLLLAGAFVIPWLRASPRQGISAVVSPSTNGFTAVVSALGLSTPWAPGQTILAILTFVGLFLTVIWLRRWYSLVLLYIAFAALYAGVLSGSPTLVALSGIWYGQWYRIAVVLAIIAPIFVGVALGAIPAVLASSRVRRHEAFVVRCLRIGLITCGVLYLGVVAARYALRGQSIVASAWTPHTVTEADAVAFERIAKSTKAKDEVLTYWADGSTWMYAMQTQTPAVTYDNAIGLLPWAGPALRPRTLLADPSTCKALLVRNVKFAFAKPTLNDYSSSQFLLDLEATPQLFHRVWRLQNGSSFFRIDAQILSKCAAAQ